MLQLGERVWSSRLVALGKRKSSETYDEWVRSNRDLVEALATALDTDDYTTVASLMADGVEYVIGDQRHTGPEAVVTSYREGSKMARRLFDQVVFRHAVFSTDDPNIFRVEYSDELTAADETFTHRVEQHVTVSRDEGIVSVVDVEVPGEQERLNAFLSRHGLARDR